MDIKDYFNHKITSESLAVLAREHPMSENAQWLLEQRYFAQRYDPETRTIRKERDFAELVRRVSRVIASAEALYSDNVEWVRTLEKNIAADMLSKRFCFNSPCLFNAGAGLTTDSFGVSFIYRSIDEMTLGAYKTVYSNRQKNQQLFACFVVDVPDSIDGIFQSVKDAAIISKYGGGVGASFGHIRERGAKVHDGGNGGVASGPVSFMRTWDTMADVVVQGGKRRAALMGMLPIDHPDIEEFINCKTEDGKLPYFNISVAVTDEFMDAVHNKKHMAFLSPTTYFNADTVVDAGALFDKLCTAAWQRGDPGVFFIDTANKDNLLKMSDEWKIESTNPCGEQPLPNYTSCNLGSINVSEFVKDDDFDWEALNAQIIRSMYYLDLVIDASVYPLEKIEERTKRIRPVGLGIMGLADALIKLGVIYGSKASMDWANFIARTFSTASLAATVLNPKEPFSLAEEADLGIPSLNSALSALASPKNTFLGEEARFIHSQVQARKFRNSRRLSLAPTGSISMLLDTSPGIEPNFAWHWTRKVSTPDGGTEELDYWHPLLKDSQKHMIRLGEKITALPFEEDQVYVTAHDVTPEQHVEMAAVFAPYIDSGISKTVNLPNSATVEDVKNIYLKAYKAGLKGITIYRDGSRSTQPIETKPEKTELATAMASYKKAVKEFDPEVDESDIPDFSEMVLSSLREGLISNEANPVTLERVCECMPNDFTQEMIKEVLDNSPHVVKHDDGTYSFDGTPVKTLGGLDINGIPRPVRKPPFCHGCPDEQTGCNLCYREYMYELADEFGIKRPKDNRPALVTGKTIKDTTPWGSIYVTLNFDGNEPFETFINVGKSGSELKAMTEALGRVISIGLRSGCRLEDFIATLKGLSGKEYWMLNSDDEHVVRSLPDAIAILLSKLSEPAANEQNEESDRKPEQSPKDNDVICPECGSPMELISGCSYCFSCGYSPCK